MTSGQGLAGYGQRISACVALGFVAACSSGVSSAPPGEVAAQPEPDETCVATPVEWKAEVLYQTLLGPFGDGGADIDGDAIPDIVVSNRALHRDPSSPPWSERDNSVSAISVVKSREVQRWSGGPGFGYRVALGGDADGDGCADVLVTTGDARDMELATVEVLSGRTGERLLHVTGRNVGDDVAWLGDLDGDGLSDFSWTVAEDLSAARLPPCGRHHGCFGVEWRSGRTGALIARHTRESDGYDSALGALEPLGDVDLDGTPDVLVVLPRDASACSDRNLVAVLSGDTGGVIDEFPEIPVGHEAHEAISGAGDVNGDGAPDFLVGNENHFLAAPGEAWLVSTRAHQVLRHWVGSHARDSFGWAVAGLGDATGDGIPDVAIGAPGFGDSRGGFVSFFSGSDGTLLAELMGDPDSMGFSSGPKLGLCVRAAGDTDGNGRTEVLVGQISAFELFTTSPDIIRVVGLAPR